MDDGLGCALAILAVVLGLIVGMVMCQGDAVTGTLTVHYDNGAVRDYSIEGFDFRTERLHVNCAGTAADPVIPYTEIEKLEFTIKKGG